jgi:hypothetical protein
MGLVSRSTGGELTMQTERLKELFQQAAEISASVPEPLREAAFHRALNVLLGEAHSFSAPVEPIAEPCATPPTLLSERPRSVRFVTPLPRMRSTPMPPAPLPVPAEANRLDLHRPSGALRKRRARDRICALLRQLSEDGYFDRPRSNAELFAHVQQLIGPLCTPVLLAKALRQLEREGTLACDHKTP